MMKYGKRIGAALLVVCLALGLGVTASAATSPLVEGSQDEKWNEANGNLTGTSFTVTLKKHSAVWLPGTQFTYEIGTVTSEDVEGSAGYTTDSGLVAGPQGGVYFGTQSSGQSGVASTTVGSSASGLDNGQVTVAFTRTQEYGEGDRKATINLAFDNNNLIAGKINLYTLQQNELNAA